jgi:hypothetical protein
MIPVYPQKLRRGALLQHKNNNDLIDFRFANIHVVCIFQVLHYNKELDYLQPLHMAEIYKPTLTMELPTLRYKVKKNATYIHMCVGKLYKMEYLHFK